MKKSLLYPNRKFGATVVILVLCAALLYWELGVGLQRDSGFVWDAPIMLSLHSLSNPILDHIFYYITRSVDLLIVFPVLAMFIYLWRRSEKITAVILLLSLAIFPLVSLVVKEQFARPRQEIFIPLVVEETYSFPSGHTLTAVGTYGLIAVLLWQRGHRVLASLSGLMVFLAALSRIYLGAHYPSDVLASLALGTLMLVIILYIDNRLNARMSKKSDFQESTNPSG